MNEDINMVMEREAGAPDHVPMLSIGWFIRPVQAAGKSKRAGYPIFEDREWIKIVIPGDRNGIPERIATDTDRQRWPRSYAAFKSKELRPAVEGYRIEEWPSISRATAMTLRAFNIDTVEALAAVSDTNVDKIPGGRELRSRAQAFVTVAKDAAAAQNYKAESDKKDAAIADLQRQIAELAAKIEGKRGPGRPPNQPKFETGPLETRVA